MVGYPVNLLTIISLRQAVEIAIQNSRAYQSQKETLYLSALALTLERHLWSPTFTSLMSGGAQRPTATNRGSATTSSAPRNCWRRAPT